MGVPNTGICVGGPYDSRELSMDGTSYRVEQADFSAVSLKYDGNEHIVPVKTSEYRFANGRWVWHP